MSEHLDWFVFTTKTAAMQRLADFVRTGHCWYVVGQIPTERAGYLAAKLDRLYAVGQTNLQASRQRKAGGAGFRLIMLKLGDSDFLHWWLLRTEGVTPPEAEREKWRDALTDRIEMTGYQLVRQTRTGKAVPAWTWRYASEQEKALREALLRTIRNRRDDDLRKLIHTVWHTPGFAGARSQVKKMAELIRGEWRRSRSNDPLPEIPVRLGYVRRLPDLGRPLSELGSKVRATRKSKI